MEPKVAKTTILDKYKRDMKAMNEMQEVHDKLEFRQGQQKKQHITYESNIGMMKSDTHRLSTVASTQGITSLGSRSRTQSMAFTARQGAMTGRLKTNQQLNIFFDPQQQENKKGTKRVEKQF